MEILVYRDGGRGSVHLSLRCLARGNRSSGFGVWKKVLCEFFSVSPPPPPTGGTPGKKSCALILGFFCPPPLGLCMSFVLGTLTQKGMERLLGGLEWAVRWAAGLAAFLANSCRWKHSDAQRVNMGLLRPLLTAISFAFIFGPSLPEVASATQ